MKTPNDFYNQYIGKRVDIDGYYGAQCWDGVMEYMRWLGYPVFHCTSTGYAKDLWNDRKTSGILKYCDEVAPGHFNDGDILVWGECVMCPLSHTAIFRKDNGNGTFIALGENQGGPNGAFNQILFTYNGVLGGLRPKCYAQQPSKPTPPKETPKQPKYTVWKADGSKKMETNDYSKALSSLSDDREVIKDQKGRVLANQYSRSVFRLYNKNNGDHVFTSNPNEVEALKSFGWSDESVAWVSPAKGNAVFRLYNRLTGEHLYTKAVDEHNFCVENGWNCEGIAFYEGGNVDVYRLYSHGKHMLTTCASERDQLLKFGWKYEGVAFRCLGESMSMLKTTAKG